MVEERFCLQASNTNGLRNGLRRRIVQRKTHDVAYSLVAYELLFWKETYAVHGHDKVQSGGEFVPHDSGLTHE